MDPIESGFSRRRWELSAAKSQVLLTGAETAANRALALALLELVVRRALRLVTTEDRILFFSRRRIVVVRDDRVSIPFHHDLDTVLRECDPSRRYADGTAGVSVAEIVKRLQRTYRGRGGFVPGVVLPALKDRGFFQQEVYSRLGIFPRSRWTITGDGIQALSELSELMFIGRGRFNEWLTKDPARAEAFVEHAGPAILLLDYAGSSIHRLRETFTKNSDRTWQADLADPERDSRRTWSNAGEPFTVASLAGSFGPGPLDGLDAAYLAISKEVAAAQSSVGGSGDGGGE